MSWASHWNLLTACRIDSLLYMWALIPCVTSQGMLNLYKYSDAGQRFVRDFAMQCLNQQSPHLRPSHRWRNPNAVCAKMVREKWEMARNLAAFGELRIHWLVIVLSLTWAVAKPCKCISSCCLSQDRRWNHMLHHGRGAEPLAVMASEVLGSSAGRF